MCSCQSIPECCVMFSGVKLSMGSFVLLLCYIPDQCKMLLKVTPNKSSYVLMFVKNDAKYHLKSHSCTLMV